MIKISTISQGLLNYLESSEKYDKKYIDGLVRERLAVLDYIKTFGEEINEQDEEEEIELDPEEIPIEKEEPQSETEPKTEVEPEPEEEPEIDSEDEEIELEPENIPVPKPLPLIPTPKEDYEVINRKQAQELLLYKGKIFTAVFNKREDGSLRAMNGMTGVRKFTVGGELPYSPKDKQLIPVYDLKIGLGRKGYRMIPIEGLKTLNIGGKKYKIDQTIKEIKVNTPNKLILPKDKNWVYLLYDESQLDGFYREIERQGLKWLSGRPVEKTGINSFYSIPSIIGRTLNYEYPNVLYNNDSGVTEVKFSIRNYIDRGILINPQDVDKFKTKYNLQENMKKKELYQIVKEVLLEIKSSPKLIKEEDEGKKINKTNFDFKSTFEDLVIKTNTSKPSDFNSLKQEWLDRIKTSKINPATKVKMDKDVTAANNLITLQKIATYGLLNYEKMRIRENEAPQRSPQRQAPDRETITKPETDTPERKPKRRTLNPPIESPPTRPKAEGVIKENEEEIVKKIANRFTKLK